MVVKWICRPTIRIVEASEFHAIIRKRAEGVIVNAPKVSQIFVELLV